jgi:hypothetical protein
LATSRIIENSSGCAEALSSGPGGSNLSMRGSADHASTAAARNRPMPIKNSAIVARPPASGAHEQNFTPSQPSPTTVSAVIA